MAVVMVLSMCHLTVIPIAWAQEKEEGSTEATESQGGLGVASVLLSIPYGIAKVVYAGLGAIIGGFAYVLTGFDDKPAKKIWDTSIRGTYLITPDHLKGNKPVRFLGVPPEEEAASEQLPAEPTPAAPEPPK
ncbi:MAG TPA: hypothetical protein VFL31_04065 [Nitrospiraceae bacterium]|nr:hypothetical protein [Nitrospiraceae bacterium]